MTKTKTNLSPYFIIPKLAVTRAAKGEVPSKFPDSKDYEQQDLNITSGISNGRDN